MQPFRIEKEMNPRSLNLSAKRHVEFREQVCVSEHQGFHPRGESRETPACHHRCFTPEGSKGHPIHREPQPSASTHKAFGAGATPRETALFAVFG